MYKTNHITKVILRVDFFQTREDINKKVLQQFKSELKLKYKDLEYTQNPLTNFQANFSNSKPSVEVSRAGFSGRYSFDSDTKRFVLDQNSFVLEGDSYKNFNDFFDIFKTGFNILQSIAKGSEFGRIGLRFVNTIKENSIKDFQGWDKYINNKFIPDIQNQPALLDFSPRRCMTEYFFGNGTYLIRLYLGLWNPQFPSKIINSDFIVDIDCFVKILLDDQEVIKLPPEMSEFTFNFYKQIITPRFEENLNGGIPNEKNEG